MCLNVFGIPKQAPFLMTSHDSVQLDMIQLTPFYDPDKFFLKQGIFELLWTNSLIQGVIDSRFQGHIMT